MKTNKKNDILCYTGSKRKVVAEIWNNFGKVSYYIEPFCGSAVVYEARPVEVNKCLNKGILNDTDGLLCNYLRTLHYKRDEFLDYLPKFKDRRALEKCAELIDLDAVNADLESSPKGCNAQQAAYYFYYKNLGFMDTTTMKPKNKNPYTKLLEADLDSHVVTEIYNVDWKKVLSNAYTNQYAVTKTKTAVLLDPPYDGTEDYYSQNSKGISSEAYDWALANASERLRIAYCCYDDQFPCPAGWKTLQWAGVTFTGNNENTSKRSEVIYFSPHSELPA